VENTRKKEFSPISPLPSIYSQSVNPESTCRYRQKTEENNKNILLSVVEHIINTYGVL